MSAGWLQRLRRRPGSDLVARAQAAERAQDWEAAGRLWTSVRASDPDQHLAWIGQATAMRAAGDPVGAFALLAGAPASFADRAEFVVVSAALGDVEGIDASIVRWVAVTRRYPFVADGFIAATTLLIAANRLEEAESIVDLGLAAHPCNFRLLSTALELSVRTGSWGAAERRLGRLDFLFRDEPFMREKAPALRARIREALGTPIVV